ncbi:MAG: trehalose-phosphatase [Chlamydiales bacterium]
MIPLKQNPSLINDFFQKVRDSRGGTLFLDYDGTLAPFTTDRDHAYPYPEAIPLLENLMSHQGSTIFIISGRNVREVQSLLKLSSRPKIWGCHGWEWLSPQGEYHAYPLDESIRHTLEFALEEAKRLGLEKVIEVKPFSLALHWRGIDEQESENILDKITPIWKRLSENHPLELFPFDGGVELRALGQNKGKVIEEVLGQKDTKFPIAYLGDDLTDEQAFASVGNKGLKVLVRQELRDTLADLQLIPPEGLLGFLNLWIKAASH